MCGLAARWFGPIFAGGFKLMEIYEPQRLELPGGL